MLWQLEKQGWASLWAGQLKLIESMEHRGVAYYFWVGTKVMIFLSFYIYLYVLYTDFWLLWFQHELI